MREVIVFGAAGYSGLELLRILAGHPEVEVRGASSVQRAGQPVSSAVFPWRAPLSFEPHDVVLKRARRGQIAFLATPAKTSAELAPLLLEEGVAVIDLSGAFRLIDPEAYPSWYGFEHPQPQLLQEAHYGLFELFAPDDPKTVRLVANPGCYATAAILATAPLVGAGLLDPVAPVIIDGKSGTTGAGRTLDEKLLFSEVAENLRPYRLARHQHTPEMEQALARVANREVRVSFTAHLVPMRRGLLTSVYGRPRSGLTQERVDEAYAERYAGSAFVKYGSEVPPETASVAHENYVLLGAKLDERAGVLSAFAAIDNLVKGAAGQAVQNLNLLLGVNPETGLRP